MTIYKRSVGEAGPTWAHLGRVAAVAIPVILLIAGWDLVAVLGGYGPTVLPTPAAVLTDILDNPGVYASSAASTLGSSLAGLGMGMGTGVLVGVATYYLWPLQGLLTPALLALRSVPVVISAPLCASLFGYGETTLLVIVGLIVFFPSYLLTTVGLASTPPTLLAVFDVMGASRWQRLVRGALPHALPSLATALKVAAGSCVGAAMISEFVMDTPGLGHLLQVAQGDLDTPRAWGAGVVATVVAFALFGAATLLEQRTRRRFHETIEGRKQ